MTAILVARDGTPVSLRRLALLSGAWGAGAGAGVAAGAVLTAVGGSGAPGLAGVDVTSELLVAPWLVVVAVFAVHFGVCTLAARVRGERSRRREAQQQEHGESRAEDGVDGQIGREVPAAER